MLGRVLVVALAACGMAMGQVPRQPKTLAFEVVSIKPSGEFDVNRVGGFGTNPSGYYAKGLPLSTTVMMAYFPVERMNRPSTILGWPPSLDKDAYSIEAKFDAATAQAWMRMTTAQQREMIQPMLQAMLAERCKLKVHMTSVIEPAYELVVTKHGAKLKETMPGEAPPEHAFSIGGDAMMVPMANPKMKAAYSQSQDQVVFFRTPMTAFATWLSSGMSEHVVDRTGLTGKYDFALPKPVRPTPVPQAEGEASDPASRPLWLYDLSKLGLKLRPGKAPEPTLAVDHIEKPTPN